VASPAGEPSVIRFGAFELDAASGELRKAGRSLKIHPQPFRVLLLLTERSGQIVTREEIRHCLWGNNTCVDFDGGINFCVNQIRAALADDAENPRYIETLPRRGYRFIAPNTLAHPAKHYIPFAHAPELQTSISREQPKMAARASAEFPSSLDIHVVPLPVPRNVEPLVVRKTALPIIAGVSAVAILAVGVIFNFHRSPKLTERDTVVLADFNNATGDPEFDDALRQALAADLGQSPFLNVLSDKKTDETMRMMGLPANQRATVGVGRELCLRTGSKAVLGGAISSLGRHYLVDVSAVACGSGDTLANEQVEAASKEDVLKALSRATSSLRTQLGESLPSVQKFDAPVEATTTSLDALKSYSMGLKILEGQGEVPSIPFFKRAIDLDPNFAMAYAGLAGRYGNLNQVSLALKYATKAYELRDRVTERERLLISARYFRLTGALEEQAQIFALWMADYPRDSSPHGSLGGNYVFMGQYEKALAEWQEALRLEPDTVAIYENLGEIYLALNRLDEAKATFDQALARKLDSGGLRWMMYYLAFLRGNSAQMEEQVLWSAGKPGDEDALLSAQSDTEAFYGRLSKARDFTSRAVGSAIRSDNKETAALWQVSAALRETEFGETAVAKRDVMEALALSPGRNVRVFAALALARIGETARAEKLVQELEKSDSSNTVLSLYRLPAVNAAIGLNRGNSSQALVLLEAAAPYELGQPSPSPLGTLYPVYLRGQAYLLAHNGAAAAAEFQKLLDHPGIALNFPLGVLAHLQMARAFVTTGDTAKAKGAYKDFLTLWKDADPDIPILKKAKAEYAKLQ
jgi:DNA-binding winged helix-turn-helix (wHTH) protein/tetratricopeptide (TPR) repeat protein